MKMRTSIAVTAALAAVSVSAVTASVPAEAATAVQSHTATKLTSKQMYDRCLDTRIVVHRSNRVRKGPDVDTKAWIRRAMSIGRWIEEDLQHSGSHQLTGWMFHDLTLNALTNGSGAITHRTNSYIARLRTVHHNRLAPYSYLLNKLHQNPTKRAQLEWKNYNNEFTAEQVQELYQQQVDRGVQTQIYDSSHWPSVLRTLEAIDPSIYTELIGFGNQQPNLSLATDSKSPANERRPFDQINVNYVAAFRPYGGYAHYAKAVLAKGLKLSIRSNPNGQGDNPAMWRRAIQMGATALVVQGHGKQYVCNAVRG
jgi:hypothetical protein